jgi:hypothetical protein
MPVALVVAEKQILAMSGVDLFPVLQCKFYCRKWGMVMSLVLYSILLQKIMYFFYFFVHDYPRKLNDIPLSTQVSIFAKIAFFIKNKRDGAAASSLCKYVVNNYGCIVV